LGGVIIFKTIKTQFPQYPLYVCVFPDEEQVVAYTSPGNKTGFLKDESDFVRVYGYVPTVR
jgi:hypothetical protein